MPNAQDRQLIDELEETVRMHVITKMPADSTGELSSMPLRNVLSIYWTWRERFLASRPRNVHRARDLAASQKAQEFSAELAELERKIHAGDDLTPHLSDRVETAFISAQERPTVPGKRRDADHDRMLAAWGIHHLHLSSGPGKDGFNARGPDLLYAIFRLDDAYLLGIYTHNDWARKQLVEVIVRNWPDAGLFSKSDYVQGTTTEFTDEDRTALRRANVNEVLFEVDGAFYGPPGLGLTATAGSFAAARRAMAYMEHLRQLRENLDERLEAFGGELDEAAGQAVTGEWAPDVHESRIGLRRGADAFIGIPWLDVD